MRTSAGDLALEQILTRERLGKYIQKAAGNLSDALTLYEANTKLSESFYGPLQCLEICLRNSLDQSLAAKYGLDWMDVGTCPIAPDGKQAIGTARNKISKASCRHGDIVAELGFGFWVGLLGPRYDATLWRGALHKAFLPGGGKPRKEVHGRFNTLRRLRNRVAHHEPIFDRDLEQDHAEIIEAVGWMSRDAKDWISHQSRFPEAFQSGST